MPISSDDQQAEDAHMITLAVRSAAGGIGDTRFSSSQPCARSLGDADAEAEQRRAHDAEDGVGRKQVLLQVQAAWPAACPSRMPNSR